MRFRTTWAGVAVLLLVIGACSDPNVGLVSGTVTVDGKSLEKGAIQFVPVDGKTATSGAMIADGRYSAEVPVGMMKVSISAPKVVGQKKIYNTPDSPVMPLHAEALPAKYNEKTELTLEVKPGTNPKNFELTGK